MQKLFKSWIAISLMMAVLIIGGVSYFYNRNIFPPESPVLVDVSAVLPQINFYTLVDGSTTLLKSLEASGSVGDTISVDVENVNSTEVDFVMVNKTTKKSLNFKVPIYIANDGSGNKFAHFTVPVTKSGLYDLYIKNNADTISNILTYNITPRPTYGTGYDLFTVGRGVRVVDYIKDGTVPAGKYTGYNVVIGVSEYTDNGLADGLYYRSDVFITKDYKTFILYIDPNKGTDHKDSLASGRFNIVKVVDETSDVQLLQPAIIEAKGFVLVRGYIVVAEEMDLSATSTTLKSLQPGLTFFSRAVSPETSAHPERKSAMNQYFDTNNIVFAQDAYEVVYAYHIIPKEHYLRHVEMLKEGRYTSSYYYNDHDSMLEAGDLASGLGTFTTYGNPLSGGCSANQAAMYVLKNITKDDLIPVGATVEGVSLSIFKDKLHPLYKAQYNSQGSTIDGTMLARNPDSSSYATSLTLSQFVEKNPLFVFEDPFGRLMLIGETQYVIGGCGKPVIYLYPTEPTDVSVSFIDEVSLTKAIPAYAGGWKVHANPQGELTDLQPRATNCSKINSQVFGSEYAYEACLKKTYPYIYWAGSSPRPYPAITGGFIVTQKDLKSVLDEKLIKIGLTDFERADMESYWMHQMLAKDAPYYRITLFQTDDLNTFIPMNVLPRPDTVIRVFLDWEPLNESVAIKPQEIRHIDRTGFTYVEWGGLMR